MAKIGRPTLYSEELTQKICDRIASSSDGLHKICKELKIAPSAVFDWLTKYPEFTDKYTRAREAQADFMADEIIEISDEDARKSQRGVNEMKVGAFVNAKRLQIDARKWIASTNGMRADFRAWYLDLFVYQYDKGGIPNDEDFIAGICRVRPSEYELFKQMLEQVLKQKFVLGEDNLYRNMVATEVLKKREQFLDKRKKSGTIGQIIKMAKEIKGFSKYLDLLKTDLFEMELDDLNKQMDKQVLEQKLKLYINVDVDVNKDNNIDIKKEFNKFWDLYDKKTDSKKCFSKWQNLKQSERDEIFKVLPKYVKSTPDKQYRKNPETWLNQRGWEHEIIIK